MHNTTRLILAGVLIIAAIWAVQRFTAAGPTGGPRTDADIAVPSDAAAAVRDKERRYERAKELVGPTGFVNGGPFRIADLIGAKVVLVDFWTYSCINCQRTIPYLNDWYTKYRDKGFVIVGVHTPEFEFEKDIANVRAAVEKFGIRYPVVLDSDYGTWRAYRNQYWPHKYLVDTDGFIIYDHIGEGGYEETERRIQEALAEHMARVGMPGSAEASIRTPENAVSVDFRKVRTPETYFGASRNAAYLGNAVTGRVGRQTLAFPSDGNQKDSATYLAGEWEFADEYARCVRDCRVRIRYEARQVNLVASAEPATTIRVLRDGAASHAVSVSRATLYTLVDGTEYGVHQLELEVMPGTDLYTFTFG